MPRQKWGECIQLNAATSSQTEMTSWKCRRRSDEHKLENYFLCFSLSSFDFLHLPFLILSLFIERLPAYRITQLFATCIWHCWIVVVVTTGNSFHNGLKQSLWKQSFCSAINNPMCTLWNLLSRKHIKVKHKGTFFHEYVDGSRAPPTIRGVEAVSCLYSKYSFFYDTLIQMTGFTVYTRGMWIQLLPHVL